MRLPSFVASIVVGLTGCATDITLGGRVVDASAPDGSTGDAGCTLTQGTNARTTLHAGRERSFEVLAPAGIDPCTVRAALFLFHGERNAADPARDKIARVVDAASRAGMLAIFPRGTVNAAGRESWACAGCDAALEAVDDVGFVRSIVTQLALDPRRVAAVGVDVGGSFVHRLAAELPLAAGVVRGGSVGAASSGGAGSVVLPKAPAAPVTMILHHGDADVPFPFAGGQAPSGGPYRTSFAESVEFWRAAGSCTPLDRRTTAQTDVGRAACQGGASLVAVQWLGSGNKPPEEDPENPDASFQTAIDLAVQATNR